MTKKEKNKDKKRPTNKEKKKERKNTKEERKKVIGTKKERKNIKEKISKKKEKISKGFFLCVLFGGFYFFGTDISRADPCIYIYIYILIMALHDLILRV